MTKKVEKKFDRAKLAQMIEPLVVRVEKTRNGQKIPIPIPSPTGDQPNVGMTIDSINGLEQMVRDVLPGGGGGYYNAQVVDANNTVMEWQFGYPVSDYPELSASGQPAQKTTTSAPSQPTSIWGSNVSQPSQTVQSQPPQQISQTLQNAQPSYPPQYAAPAYQAPNYAPQYPAYQSYRRESGSSSIDRDLQDRIARLEREKQDALHQAALDKLNQQHASQLDALRSELRALAEKPKGEDETVRMLREEIARIKEESSRKEEKSEMMQLIQQMQQQNREQMQLMQQQLQQATQSRPDPLVEMMKENARAQAEVAKEAARSQQTQMQLMQNMMMNPAQLASMMKENSSGTEHFLKSMIESTSGMMNMQRNVIEQMMQLQGGSDPKMEMFHGVREAAQQIADRYISAQRDINIAKSREEVARAEAATHAADLERSRLAQSMGLTGQQALEEGDEEETEEEETQEEAPTPIAAKQGRPSDEEMFGEAFEHIERLRLGVAEGHLNEEEAAGAILQGVSFVIANKMSIPAFVLFADQRYADFIDVLIPKAPQPYRDKVAQLVMQAALQWGREPELSPDAEATVN